MTNALQGKHIGLIGFGDINQRVAKLLAGSGAELVGFKRNIADIDAGDVMLQSLDVSQPIDKLPSFDYVMMTLSPGARSDETYRKTYVDGLRNVLNALPKEKLKQFFWVSSSSVFAQDDECWVDETSPTEPVKSTAKILLEAEKLLEPLDDKACTLRFSGIYRGHKHRMVDNIRAGALSAHIEQDYFTNRIHVEDCARALVHLLALHSQGNEIDRLYIGSDDEPVKYSEVIQWISEQTGCALNETLEPVKKRVGSKRLSNARLKSTGFELLYPSFRQGFLQAVKG